MGVESGDHVGILAPNLIEVMELLFAVFLSGAVAVFLNGRYKSFELAYVVDNADLKWLFASDCISAYTSYIELLYAALPGFGEAENLFALSLPSAPKLKSIVLMEPTSPSGFLNNTQFQALVRCATEVAIPHATHATHVTAYRSTELTGVISFSHPQDSDDIRAVRSGKPFAGIKVKIINPQSHEEVAPGEHGEIIVSGFCVFEGYYKSEKKNAEAFDENGWFVTGDIGSVDTLGRIAYHGRFKDMLKVRGENVAAIEIESYLSTHPAVAIVQVVGVPGAELVEVAAAFVELKPDAVCSEEELIEFCQNQIASFKVPRHIRFLKEWPMSSSKIQKFKLRDSLVDELDNG